MAALARDASTHRAVDRPAPASKVLVVKSHARCFTDPPLPVGLAFATRVG